LISTVTITSQETITAKIGSAIIRSREVRVAGSNGSTTPKTEKELLTGIMPQPRSLIEELQQKPLSHAKHSADAPNRAGRTLPAAEPTNSRVARMPASEAAPFQALTGAAAQKTSVAAEVPVAKVCPVEVEDSAVVLAVAEVVDSAAVLAVAEVAVVAAVAVEGGSHVKSSVNNKEI